MLESQKHAFWQALLVTILIFGIGILLGFILENWRTSKIDLLAQESEIDLLDIKLQSEIYSESDFDCGSAVEENINFAERVFEEAKLLEKYDSASRLTEDVKIQHKKYDVLRAMLLLNSQRIKERCNAEYYEIVYFYQFNEPSLDTKSKQNVFSKMLMDFKERKGSEVLLIPMSGDNGVVSINLIMESYGISVKDLPVIVVNGELKIKEIMSVDEFEESIENGFVDNVIRL